MTELKFLNTVHGRYVQQLENQTLNFKLQIFKAYLPATLTYRIPVYTTLEEARQSALDWWVTELRSYTRECASKNRAKHAIRLLTVHEICGIGKELDSTGCTMYKDHSGLCFNLSEVE